MNDCVSKEISQFVCLLTAVPNGSITLTGLICGAMVVSCSRLRARLLFVGVPLHCRPTERVRGQKRCRRRPVVPQLMR